MLTFEEKEMEIIFLEARVRRDTEINERRRHESEESDNKINARRQKVNLDLPVQIIKRICVSPLESKAHEDARKEVQAPVDIRGARVQLWEHGRAHVWLEDGEEVQGNPGEEEVQDNLGVEEVHDNSGEEGIQDSYV